MNARLVALVIFLLVSQGIRAAPNLLIVYVDDLGYGDTGAYGHPVVQTPNIDRLAEEGVRFTQFYAPSALCSPSRAGLLTGRTPYRTGIKSWIPDNSEVSLDRREITIAKLMQDEGYRTAVIGKWHLNGGLGLRAAPQPVDFGFDHQYGLDGWVKNKKAAAAGEGKLYPDNMYRNNEPVGETDKFSAELVSDEAIRWLEEDWDKPFFLFLTYSEVHTPIMSPVYFLEMYDQYRTSEAIDNPWSYHMDWGSRPYRGKGEYYANISFLDAQLGRILALLRDRQQLDNTLIVFSSDNGPVRDEASVPWEYNMAGETDGLRGKKRYLFEGGIRVPGIFRWPGKIPADQTRDVPATSLDILPTIAEYFDLELPGDREIDGESIVGLLDDSEDTKVAREKIFYWSLPTPDGMEYTVREGDWKMILDPAGKPVYLFDLKRDRYEVTNLLEQEQAIAVSLKNKFDAYRRSVESEPALKKGE